MSRPLTIFLSAAEASGDHHGAKLIASLRRQLPDARFVGAAGPQMAAQGCEVIADLTTSASMVGGPFLKLHYYHRMVKRLQKSIREIRPDVHVPIDSPALNWHLAKTARQCGSKVVYFIAPQVWAWAPWRVKKLRNLTDAVACILPFEQEYLRARGVNATFVGHPLFDDMPPLSMPQPDLLDAWSQGQWKVALVPGSRPGEIRSHAPALLEIARRIRRTWPQSQCVMTAHNSLAEQQIRSACPDWDEQDATIAVGRTREVLATSNFGVVKSGTVTLEAAFFGLPMVILYRTSRLMILLRNTLGRIPWLMATRHLSLVNILARQRLVTELMPWSGNVETLWRSVRESMDDLGYLCEMRKGLTDLVGPLLPGNIPGAGPNACAAENAARLVLSAVK